MSRSKLIVLPSLQNISMYLDIQTYIIYVRKTCRLCACVGVSHLHYVPKIMEAVVNNQWQVHKPSRRIPFCFMWITASCFFILWQPNVLYWRKIIYWPAWLLLLYISRLGFEWPNKPDTPRNNHEFMTLFTCYKTYLRIWFEYMHI